MARRFDDAFRPLNLKSGQFSLLMSLNRDEAPNIGPVSALLGMDCTTLTASLKPLERNGWVKVIVDIEDKRSRRMTPTPAGRKLLAAAFPPWRRAQAQTEQLINIGSESMRAISSSEAMTKRWNN